MNPYKVADTLEMEGFITDYISTNNKNAGIIMTHGIEIQVHENGFIVVQRDEDNETELSTLEELINFLQENT